MKRRDIEEYLERFKSIKKSIKTVCELMELILHRGRRQQGAARRIKMKVQEDIPNTNQEPIFGAECTCQQKEREAMWMDYRLGRNQRLHNSQKSEMRLFTWKRKQRQSGHAWAQSVEAGVCMPQGGWVEFKETSNGTDAQGPWGSLSMGLGTWWKWLQKESGCSSLDLLLKPARGRWRMLSKKVEPLDWHLRGDC